MSDVTVTRPSDRPVSRPGKVDEHRQDAVRNPALWTLLGLGICMVLLGAMVAGTFKVTNVKVVGSGLPDSEVVQTADVVGHNIFSVQSDQVVTRLNGVREITVQRVDTTFPNTVTIYAQLRERLAALQVGKTLYALDRQGRIVGSMMGAGLPRIVSADGSTAIPPPMIQAVRYAQTTLAAAPAGQIATFTYSRGQGAVIEGVAGWKANVGQGSAQTLVNRIATLALLLTKVDSQHQRLHFVDLRFRVPYARTTTP